MSEMTANQLADWQEHLVARKRLEEKHELLASPSPNLAVAPEITKSQETTVLVEKIRQHLCGLGISTEKVEQFLELNHSYETLSKLMSPRYESGKLVAQNRLPTLDELEKYRALSKNTKGLCQIKFPTLCDWTVEEVIEALTPYLGKHAKKFKTKRCPIEDCKQNGVIGVFNALRTDIGMSPFAWHAYLHIKTNTRRRSAEAGTVQEPEKRPSETEVRRVVTSWLNATIYEYEVDRRIRTYGGETKLAPDTYLPIKEGLEYESLGALRELKDAIRRATGQEKTELSIILKKIDDGVKGWLEQLSGRSTYQIASEAPVRMKKWATQFNKQIRLNSIPLLSINDFILHKIQKIGKANVYEKLINTKIPLVRFGMEIKQDLVEYLVAKFRYCCSGRSGLRIQTDRFESVADLVKFFAMSPDFQGNASAIQDGNDEDNPGKPIPDDTFPDPSEETADQEYKDRKIKFVHDILKKLSLSQNQRTVMEHRFGLFGKKQVNGSELAENFRRFSGALKTGDTILCECGLNFAVQDSSPIVCSSCGKKHGKVSRQRVAQYEDAGDKKFLDAAYEEIIDDPKFYKLQKNIRLNARLTPEEDKIFCLLYGIKHKLMYELDKIAEQYDVLIGNVNSCLPNQDKREHLRRKFKEIKVKIVRGVFGLDYLNPSK